MKIDNDKPTIEYSGNTLSTLQLIFLTLKLAGLVDWSWWFVFTPGIISIVVTTILILVMLYIYKK